jgi:hypothetical protein
VLPPFSALMTVLCNLVARKAAALAHVAAKMVKRIDADPYHRARVG